jgi:hypothetical protein
LTVDWRHRGRKFTTEREAIDYLESKIKLVDCVVCRSPLVTHETQSYTKSQLYRRIYKKRYEAVCLVVFGKSYCSKCVKAGKIIPRD